MGEIWLVVALSRKGEPVGVIAAQSIGEPGTQLTMRTFPHWWDGEQSCGTDSPRSRSMKACR